MTPNTAVATRVPAAGLVAEWILTPVMRMPATRKARGKRWSRRVTERSNALDLEKGVFTQRDPKRIARSLKRSAERSRRRKSDPYRSAMSMLTFYVNRGGRNLSAAQRKRLESAKNELRRLYRRDTRGRKKER